MYHLSLGHPIMNKQFIITKNRNRIKVPIFTFYQPNQRSL
ncbi:hypothetical protein HMPREF0497_0217 [Lentilactobacillus buchneri ATCC 11577]|nr:hypothetical protein HMPREF0497_0217 [Lentilactobacillus buchneri ATCC 11577]